MLYKFGADSKEAQYLLKQNFTEFKRRQKLTLATDIYDEYAITTSDSIYSSTELAKASDVLLTFNGVEASFSKKVAGGFRIGPKDGGYFISFTDETFNELISEYLRPATKKLLFG